MIENIADLVKEKRIEGISDLNDESNREGMRVVVELKKDANPQVVLNQLYRFTQLQDTVRRHHAGAGRRRAQGHEPEGRCSEVYRVPGRGHPPQHPV